MARKLNRLSARAVAGLAQSGRHADGGGLYLSVGPGEARRWVFLYRWRGRLKEMGLGGLRSVSLARAREKAGEARALIADGIDPLLIKQAKKSLPTFGEMADQLVADLGPQWRNDKHRAQWSNTLASPELLELRQMRIDQVTTSDVVSCLKKSWTETPETAARLRGRIERVLDAAKAKGLRDGENPARWRGHLEHFLPKRQKLTRGHHAALPYQAVPAFVRDLSTRSGTSALALEFLILTAARSGEVRGATWSEVDLIEQVWTVPARRMKAGRAHRVPLSSRAAEILRIVKPLTGGRPDDLIFPSNGIHKPLSDAAFSALLKRMGHQPGELTTHGFRSSFRDWAGEATEFPRELAEAALAHVVGDETERAYRRGDALERRRTLMNAWAEHVLRQPVTTVPVSNPQA